MELKEPLPEEEQKALFEELKRTNDPNIRDTLILHNLRLVNWVAIKYHRPGKNDLDDLFQSGTIGLMKAIEGYETDRGTFGNYATWWIKQSITRDIDNHSKVIRIPVHMVQEVNKLRRLINTLTKNLGREPTPEELSLYSGKDIKSVNEILNIIQDPISLQTITGEDESITLEDSIPDDGPPIDLIIEDKIFLEQFRELAKEKLTELQLNIILMYYGLEGQEYNLQEIATKYDYNSREYIRAERDKGLRILRQTRYFQEIRGEVEERTSYIRGIDYSRPKTSGGGYKTSSVESIVLSREYIRERLEKKYNI